MAMRDIIKKAIEEGGATKESLLELTGTTEKGLASQFTYLRMMGHCPMKQDDGTWKIVSSEEWEAHRAAGGGTTGKVLTPAEAVEKAQKRSNRASTAFTNAQKAYEADIENREKELKYIKAEAELELSEILLGKAEAVLAAAPSEEPADDGDDDGDDEVEADEAESEGDDLE